MRPYEALGMQEMTESGETRHAAFLVMVATAGVLFSNKTTG